MATYFGRDKHGQLNHIRVTESLPEWHVRCLEQGEIIRKVREDYPNIYSTKRNFERIRKVEAALADIAVTLSGMHTLLEGLRADADMTATGLVTHTHQVESHRVPEDEPLPGQDTLDPEFLPW